MKAKINIDAGICGFRSTAWITSQDNQNVTFLIETNCDKIAQVGHLLKEKGIVDAYQEISPKGPSVIMTTAHKILTGCCAGCAVPVGLFKGMQVAAGLALPKDINIKLAKEE